MSDLADLTRQDDPLTPRHRPRRRRRGRGAALLLFFVLVLALVAGVVLGGRAVLGQFSKDDADYSGQGDGQVVVQVRAGDTASAIAATLQTEGVVKSRTAFTKAATADERSRSLQPGFYRLRTHMSGAAAVALMLDPAARDRSRVTLPEGVTVAVALQKIASSTDVSLADLQAAAADPAAIGLPAYAKGQLEGFLYPATYDVEPGSSATEVLKMMTARYAQAAQDVDLVAGAARIGQTPYDVLITASLIEKETAFAADRPKVARVVYNRLAEAKPLEFDSTVNYLRTEKKARLSVDDTKQESAYNTYQIQGLPPTPIDSPGDAALQAALHPDDGDWIYFVTVSKDGSSLFTSDYEVFKAAKAKSQADGVY